MFAWALDESQWLRTKSKYFARINDPDERVFAINKKCPAVPLAMFV